MTKKTLQLQSEEVFFHAYNRGVNRQQIFFCPGDYEYFIALMRRFIDPKQLVVLAYTLMPNHFHLLVLQLIPYAISSFMKRVSESYVKYLNRRMKRVGHLFQDNYKPKWVDSTSYLLYLSWYIHLNPVSAGLVKVPDAWEYGSCGLYRRGVQSDLVQPGLILDLAGGATRYWEYLSKPTIEFPTDIEKYLIDNELL